MRNFRLFEERKFRRRKEADILFHRLMCIQFERVVDLTTLSGSGPITLAYTPVLSEEAARDLANRWRDSDGQVDLRVSITQAIARFTDQEYDPSYIVRYMSSLVIIPDELLDTELQLSIDSRDCDCNSRPQYGNNGSDFIDIDELRNILGSEYR